MPETSEIIAIIVRNNPRKFQVQKKIWSLVCMPGQLLGKLQYVKLGLVVTSYFILHIKIV